MKPISEISRETGVNVNTIRAWARDGEIEPAERKTTNRGFSWHTTANAVRTRLANPPSAGRHVKLNA